MTTCHCLGGIPVSSGRSFEHDNSDEKDLMDAIDRYHNRVGGSIDRASSPFTATFFYTIDEVTGRNNILQ